MKMRKHLFERSMLGQEFNNEFLLTFLMHQTLSTVNSISNETVYEKNIQAVCVWRKPYWNRPLNLCNKTWGFKQELTGQDTYI